MEILVGIALWAWLLFLLKAIQDSKSQDIANTKRWGKARRDRVLRCLFFVGPILCALSFWYWSFIALFFAGSVITLLFARSDSCKRLGDWAFRGCIVALCIVAAFLYSFTR